MNTIKKGLLTTAAALAVGIGAMGSAQADTYASAILTIDNFRLLTAPNGPAFTRADFSTLTGTNDAHATAQLNAGFSPAAGSSPIFAPGPNLGPQCVGACPAIAADDFTSRPPFGGTFGYADQNLSGAAITVNGTPAGVLAQTRADAATAANFNVASGNSDVGTSTSFEFAFGADTTMTIAFDATPFTTAFVSGDSSPVANANARLSWSLNILDVATNTVVFTLEPDALNENSLRSATDVTGGLPLTYDPGTLLGLGGTTGTLIGGRLYQLTIQHNTLANVLQEEVPEPATLAIIAAGLLSMSLISRRRKS